MTAKHATVCSSPPHHWLLEPVAGGHAPAICKKCGVDRVFTPPVEFEWSLTSSISAKAHAEQADRYDQRARLADEVAG